MRELLGAFRDLFAVHPGATPGTQRAAAPDSPGAAVRDGTSWAFTATPTVDCAGPLESRKLRISGRARWYAGSLVGLIFLVVVMVQAATGGGSVAEIVAFELLGVAFGAFYVLAPVRVNRGNAFASTTGGVAAKAAVLAVMVAITAPMALIGGPGVTTLWIYVGVAAAILFPLRWALAVAVALAAGMLAWSDLAGGGLPWEMALVLVTLSLWMAGFAGNIRLTVELRETRGELARTAVAAERARIGRDLHDILGHSLTAIALKGGLARRLLERDPVAAGREIADVERLARDALADVRATAAGYRDVSLAGEIAVAGEVLAAAGVRAQLPTAVDDVAPAGREVFGYVVREAVTNVVRHSAARTCVIELDRTSIRVTDDGTVRPDGVIGSGFAGAGNGLAGLAERVAAVGGTFRSGRLSGGGFRVEASVADSPAGRSRAAAEPAAAVRDAPPSAGPSRQDGDAREPDPVGLGGPTPRAGGARESAQAGLDGDRVRR